MNKNLPKMSELYVTLPIGEKSTCRTQLARRLQLNGYKVGLAEISFKLSHPKLEDLYLFVDAPGRVVCIEVSEGVVTEIDALIQSINYAVRTQRLNTEGTANKIMSKYPSSLEWLEDAGKRPTSDEKLEIIFSRDRRNGRISVISKKHDTAMWLSPTLSLVLGLSQTVTLRTRSNRLARRDIKLLHQSSSLYVYTDIIEPQLLGSSSAPLLGIVSVNPTAYGRTQTYKYSAIQYKSLSKTDIDSVLLEIRDSKGQQTDFITDAVIVLHFCK